MNLNRYFTADSQNVEILKSPFEVHCFKISSPKQPWWVKTLSGRLLQLPYKSKDANLKLIRENSLEKLSRALKQLYIP